MAAHLQWGRRWCRLICSTLGLRRVLARCVQVMQVVRGGRRVGQVVWIVVRCVWHVRKGVAVSLRLVTKLLVLLLVTMLVRVRIIIRIASSRHEVAWWVLATLSGIALRCLAVWLDLPASGVGVLVHDGTGMHTLCTLGAAMLWAAS